MCYLISECWVFIIQLCKNKMQLVFMINMDFSCLMLPVFQHHNLNFNIFGIFDVISDNLCYALTVLHFLGVAFFSPMEKVLILVNLKHTSLQEDVEASQLSNRESPQVILIERGVSREGYKGIRLGFNQPEILQREIGIEELNRKKTLSMAQDKSGLYLWCKTSPCRHLYPYNISCLTQS